MSISIKKDSWHVKDGNGQYRGTAIFSSTLPSEAHQIVTESIAEINAVKATIPADYTELVTEVSDLSNAIAPTENGTTASKAYTQGAYFFHNTKFCKALTTIASGATFTLNTNYIETTVAAELLAAQNN